MKTYDLEIWRLALSIIDIRNRGLMVVVGLPELVYFVCTQAKNIKAHFVQICGPMLIEDLVEGFYYYVVFP